MAWENVNLKSGTRLNGGRLEKDEISLRYDAEKKSYGLTINQSLNEIIEKGGFYYFGLMKESISCQVAILLQKAPTQYNVKMAGCEKNKKYAYNYGVRSKKVVESIFETLGIEKNIGNIRLKISGNKSKNKDVLMFEIDVPQMSDLLDNINNGVSE